MKKERKNFIEAVKMENSKRKVFTENGAVAYETSGKNLLDFNFKLTQYRNMDVDTIKQDFSKVFFENPLIAVKFIFYVGDVRGGLGERKIFNSCVEWLAENKPKVLCSVLSCIPEYTRWDNLIKLIDLDNRVITTKIVNIVYNQLWHDITHMNDGLLISICAKWLPSINASSSYTRRLALKLVEELGFTKAEYRKALSALRAYLNVVEVKMSANNWEDIDYSSVPSQANINYSKAFIRHDEKRRMEYLSSLQAGNSKINASTAQPHEIVRKYMPQIYCSSSCDTTLEEMWKSIPNIQLNNSLVVRDGSGSMTCYVSNNSKTTCLDVATAITIYCSEHNSEAWKDKFITFSSKPSVIDLSNCTSLRDKLIRCDAETDCSNTNIAATMRLILNTAINNNMTQEDMPENIIIISDMQFDGRPKFNWNKSLFEEISDEYASAGYKLPKICFWNVSSRSMDTIPMQNNELGLILCSGFSTSNINMIMSGEIDPYKAIINQVNSSRYDLIEEKVKSVI